jgi:TrmH family RNA methyltransferase
MLTKNQVKLILSLKDKKARQQHGLFVAEGIKAFNDIMGSNLRVKTVYASKEWFSVNRHMIPDKIEAIELEQNELQKISRHQTPQDVLMLIEIPELNVETIVFSSYVTLLLETIQDPGNLGTIIRTADWYGIKNIICSTDCVDAYNPKTVDATMGSIARVNVFYGELIDVIEKHPSIPVYGAVLNGKSIYAEQLLTKVFLLTGNEGKGISEQLRQKITHPVMIPRIGQAESLNAAVATSILCDHFARQQLI